MEPRFAPVTSITVQEYLRDIGVMGDYHLLIAPKVLERADRYARFYRLMGHSQSRMVIMDNGMIETGDPGSADMLHEAAMLVMADKVMLPDVPEDTDATIELAVRASKDLRFHNLIPIVQGKTKKELKYCVDTFAKEIPSEMPFFGIPRSLVDTFGTREGVVDYIAKKFDGKAKVHMLGMSSNLLDDLTVCRLYKDIVLGMDSAIPIHMSSLITQMWEDERPRRPKDYWERNVVGRYSVENVRRVKGWLRGVNFALTVSEEEVPSSPVTDQETPELSSSEKFLARQKETQVDLS